MNAKQQLALDRSTDRLAASFLRRRCWCGARASAIRPGFPAEIEDNQIIRPATPSRNFCLQHAFRTVARSATG